MNLIKIKWTVWNNIPPVHKTAYNRVGYDFHIIKYYPEIRT